MLNGAQPLTIVTRSSILAVAVVRDLTLITDMFASQNWILVNLEPIFPSYRDQSINLNSKDDDWLICVGNTLISNSLAKWNKSHIAHRQRWKCRIFFPNYKKKQWHKLGSVTDFQNSSNWLPTMLVSFQAETLKTCQPYETFSGRNSESP